MDCGLPGSSVPGILQARILEWVAIAFSALAMRQMQITLIRRAKMNKTDHIKETTGNIMYAW